MQKLQDVDSIQQESEHTQQQQYLTLSIIDKMNLGLNVNSQKELRNSNDSISGVMSSTLIANKLRSKPQYDLEVKRLQQQLKLGKVYNNTTIFKVKKKQMKEKPNETFDIATDKLKLFDLHGNPLDIKNFSKQLVQKTGSLQRIRQESLQVSPSQKAKIKIERLSGI